MPLKSTAAATSARDASSPAGAIQHEMAIPIVSTEMPSCMRTSHRLFVLIASTKGAQRNFRFHGMPRKFR